MFNVGAGELLVLVVLIGTLILPIIAIVHAAQHTDAEFSAIGQSRVMWIIVILVSAFFCGVGWILSIYYLVAVRPKVDSTARANG